MCIQIEDLWSRMPIKAMFGQHVKYNINFEGKHFLIQCFNYNTCKFYYSHVHDKLITSYSHDIH